MNLTKADGLNPSTNQTTESGNTQPENSTEMQRKTKVRRDFDILIAKTTPNALEKKTYTEKTRATCPEKKVSRLFNFLN